MWGIANNRDTTRNQSFTYDALNRLTSAQTAGTDCNQKSANGTTKYWADSYGYDAWGNLVSKTPTLCFAESLNAAPDNQNRIHKQMGADFRYDAAGNMIFDPVTGNNYAFDPENRITGAGGYTYTYDTDGNRVEKSNGTTGTIYWYTTLGIVAESDLSGNLTSEYVFFDGDRVARKDFPSNNVSYYFSDHLKTASVVTDATGNITEDEDYYPWGGEVQFVNSDPNHYKFSGKERDAETQLDYFGARYYGNWTGRFLTPDWDAKPITVPYANFGNPQSLNLYSYTKNNPTTFGDLDGHCGEDPCKDINVTVKVTSTPKFRTNEPQRDGTYETGVRGQLTITLSKDGQPIANVPVSEKITSTTTKNGVPVETNPKNGNGSTDAAGTVKDDISLQLNTQKPASQDLVNAVKTDQTTNDFTQKSTQTLTFPGPNGATCSCTYQRTLTNDDGHGNPSKKTDSSGSNYTLKISTPQPQVKQEK